MLVLGVEDVPHRQLMADLATTCRQVSIPVRELLALELEVVERVVELDDLVDGDAVLGHGELEHALAHRQVISRAREHENTRKRDGIVDALTELADEREAGVEIEVLAAQRSPSLPQNLVHLLAADAVHGSGRHGIPSKRAHAPRL